MASRTTGQTSLPADGRDTGRLGRDRKRRRRRKHLPIPDNLIAVILAYCDASDYISLLRASESVFVTPLRFHLCSADSLSLSSLLRKYPNSLVGNQGQQLAVQVLLQSLFGRCPRNRLKHLEISNLRGITGASWFAGLSKASLVSFDLTNCARLDHGVLLDYLNNCPTTLRHLHLNGCRCVGPEILACIGRRHPGLLSLSLGSCSQRIGTPDVFALLRVLTSLKHLDLQSLVHIHDKESPESEDYFLDLLPDGIESLNLTGTKPLRLVSHDVFGTMNTYLNRSLEYMHAVQGRVQRVQDNLRALNNEGINANEMLHGNRHVLDFQPDVYIWKNEPSFRLKIRHLVLNGAGSPHSGIFRGTVATFSLGRCLREVHLAGCEGVSDWEIQALAVNCGETLTCFQMRAGTIGNQALQSLAKYCRVLGEVDVSACFGIGDDGIIALCHNLRRGERIGGCKGGKEEAPPASKRSRTLRPSLKILRVASLPRLTNRAIEAVAELTSLIILDIQQCSKVEPFAVHKTIRRLPCLVEVNAKDIAPRSIPLSLWLRNDPGVTRSLKFVNQRVFHHHSELTEGCQKTGTLKHCCIARSRSQRLSGSVPLAQMYHCLDCNMIPALDRGFCVECKLRCHEGHKTFLGSFARFSCDCPFGVDANNVCLAFRPPLLPTTEQDSAVEGGNAK
ncbi:unnamed protein product [Pseudo-nitzschia multistriata]|uniref:UBR-type domain-containing protein n=1 Tax=Pseudo-nitzschia multistriata TaxID=183589 RepID=A0A448YW76_9STRA|nr:unnamed protein product [Pseudo-nitzschia multistriata]